jgi:hypothetical protein
MCDVNIPNKLPNFIVLSPFSEGDNCSATQEIHSINPKIHYHNHRSLPPIPVLSQMNPVHSSHPIFLWYILILSSHQHLGLPSGLFHSGFPPKTLYGLIFSPLHVTCPVALVPLDLIILIILGDKYKLWSSSLCCFLHDILVKIHWEYLVSLLMTHSLLTLLHIMCYIMYNVKGSLWVMTHKPKCTWVVYMQHSIKVVINVLQYSIMI